jgi:hypothetical protein
MIVKELIKLLQEQDEYSVVVLDVPLENCRSDRNVLEVLEVRADSVVDAEPDWVFIGAGSDA